MTTDDGRQTTPAGDDVNAAAGAAGEEEGQRPEVGSLHDEAAASSQEADEAGTELEAAAVDPGVAEAMEALGSEEPAALTDTPLISLAATEPPEAPDDLAESGEPEAVAAAVEAELMEEELATLAEAPEVRAGPADEGLTTSEGEAAVDEAGAALAVEPPAEPARSEESQTTPAAEEPAPAEKPRRRGKKAREAAPGVAEAVERLSQATETAFVAAPALPSDGPLSLVAQLESLLFVADGPVPVSRLGEALEIPVREVETALAALAESYQPRGLSLQRFRDRVQLTTAPAAAPLVERFLGLAASTPLSRAALEALAIIAYQQPVTRPQIEAVRGVNSDSVIKNLLTKGLIEEAGRAEGPGRPVLYSTTTEFMQHFGLASLSDLPPLAMPTAEAPGETISELLKG